MSSHKIFKLASYFKKKYYLYRFSQSISDDKTIDLLTEYARKKIEESKESEELSDEDIISRASFIRRKNRYYLNELLSESAKLEPISKVNNPKDFSRMEKIEQESFSKYRNYWGVDAEDIEDDLLQPGAAGVALRDDDNVLVGYLYGYDFIVDDNWEDVDPDHPKNEWFIENHEQELSQFLQAAESGKVFYITNLAILASHGSNFLGMILSLKKELREKQYKYVVFGALSDSARLITQGGPAVLRRLGVTPIVRRFEDDQMMYVMKITS